MKNFKRNNAYFSLCGLNCGLCNMRLSGHCPSCGCGEHHSCSIAKCSLNYKGIEYCFQCDNFPCEKYKDADKYDSFITHLHQFKDIKKFQEISEVTYTKEQIAKVEILNFLLENYNAGRQKTFFCLAVNLLELENIKEIVKHLEENEDLKNMQIKEKALHAVDQFKSLAENYGIILKLRKK
ncbi:DUF3795 domain-containing protein [Miniphocaeibacter halophilus]|uniref:DUF3795 domain-containing protein n=1 Tax=Miniphocaeibacter halophilus TaxID=2931922 RepID=A0AC61MYT1_9FIRM|nr:DUF3795 domain-containing protein [Miniphocaeibacter halophilus]QQK08419.1 DUF3795 domain-containing protein [Miniphocaeibacter halophilus]